MYRKRNFHYLSIREPSRALLGSKCIANRQTNTWTVLFLVLEKIAQHRKPLETRLKRNRIVYYTYSTIQFKSTHSSQNANYNEKRIKKTLDEKELKWDCEQNLQQLLENWTYAFFGIYYILLTTHKRRSRVVSVCEQNEGSEDVNIVKVNNEVWAKLNRKKMMLMKKT